MELTPPSPKTPADSAAGSPEEPRASRHRAGRILTRTRSGSRSFSSSASPSPRSSAVPFSWEQRPGIPKALSPAAADEAAHPLLPLLPPPLRSHSDLSAPRRIKRSAARSIAAADPFAAALALCAKRLPGAGDDVEKLWVEADVAAPRRAASTIADRFRLLDFYGSCKATCSVVDATVRLPRTGSLALFGRRPGSDNI